LSADLENVGDRPDLTRPILELGVEDWYGLWEIYNDVARAANVVPDVTFRHQLRNQLAAMIDRDLLKAAMWSYDPPRRLTADELRNVPTDSEFWGSPQESSADEQLRVTATDVGRKAYFGSNPPA
jgi:hypothetical protein